LFTVNGGIHHGISLLLHNKVSQVNLILDLSLLENRFRTDLRLLRGSSISSPVGEPERVQSKQVSIHHKLVGYG